MEELTERTVKISKEIAAYWDLPVEFSDEKETVIPENYLSNRNEFLIDISSLFGSYNSINTVIPQGESINSGVEIRISYENDNPCIGRNDKKDITFILKNNTKEEWEGILRLELPEGWLGSGEKQYNMLPGDEIKWTISATSNDVVKPSFNINLKVDRYHDDRIWNTYTVGFALIAAASWYVKGPQCENWIKASFPGNKIDFDSVLDTSMDGTYYAKTTLFNPSARRVTIIGGTALGIKIKLDGQVIVDDPNVTRFVPAYHRAPSSKLAEIDLSEGAHLLEVEVIKEGKPLEVYILPVATRNVKKPGAKYYYIDILFVE